jgi:hypothetical protein
MLNMSQAVVQAFHKSQHIELPPQPYDAGTIFNQHFTDGKSEIAWRG